MTDVRPARSGPGRVAAADPPERSTPWRSGAILVGACVAAAVLSLLAPWALAFDPQVWLIWGRDATQGALDMDAGPSWKPLPVLLTTLLAPLGDGAQPEAWMVVARACGLLAVAGAAVLASRLGGRLAGAVAALLVLASPWWLLHTSLGNSEGLLAASVLWGVIAGLERRHGAALALALAAGLLRPELWPFVALHAAWLWRAEHAWRTAIVASLGTLGTAWLLPDALGLGGALQASEIARGTASPQSAAHAAVPGLAVLADAAGHLSFAGAAAAAAAVLPWRQAPAGLRRIALAALAYTALVALAAQGGYAGNPRYLVPATALGAVVAGVGAARLADLLRARLSLPPGRWWWPAVLAMSVALLAPLRAGDLRADVREIGWRAEQRTALDDAVARAGGAPALAACGPVRTAHLTRALVAWRLDLPLPDIDAAPQVPGVLLRSQPTQGAALEPRVPPGASRTARAPGWEIWESCGP